MSAKTIRKALGTLQDDPDDAQAWGDLADAMAWKGVGHKAKAPSGMDADELTKLLDSARQAHDMRREYDAVARLIEMQVALAHGTPREADLQADLARVVDEELLDDARSVAAYTRLLELRPGDVTAEEAIEKSEAKRAKWSDLVAKYLQEAKAAGDGAFKSSLLMSAAEAAYRFGKPPLEAGAKDSPKKGKKLAALIEEMVDHLKEAITIDPKNRRAALILERIYREQGRNEELVAILEQIATEATAKEEKIAGFVRLARVLTKKMKSPERAVAAYERVLDLSPGHPEATSALVEFFSERQMWDHLVALYDEQLAVAKGPNESAVVLQIAMVHWKMRGKPEAAEPFFERLRRSEPAHPGMLNFFREWAGSKGAQGRLTTILTDAHRVLSDGSERRQIAAELAKLAEEGAGAAKAIEQWRSILRQEPTNEAARESLKRLYRQTSGWNALTDLLRGELERLPQEPPGDGGSATRPGLHLEEAKGSARLPILREIAQIYRDHIKSDSALVTVLAQITALDKTDADAMRELARVYEALGRWRDLLTAQTRLAELEPSKSARAEIHRLVARRWLEQFSNVQNAVEAYEKVIEVAPGDREASEKLKELYNKRRAYRPLYDLLDREAAAAEGPQRREIWLEMARLAAERLDKGADAATLYKRVLEEDPSSTFALDALEKQAERDKDFATVAEALERRVLLAHDESTKLAVLQKLGAIYSERLQDHKNAMRAWRRVLELSPGHAKGLRVLRDSYLAVGDYDGLAELYGANNDWEGLVEVLSTAADKATDPALKVDLSYRAAAVYAEKLRAPERAFRAYERVLAAKPDDERAAAALIPIYEKDEKWSRLPALYEILLGHAKTDEDQLRVLDKLARVTGERLQDRVAAFGYARRAYELAPEKGDATGAALEAFERAARSANEWSAFVESLDLRLKSKRGKDGRSAAQPGLQKAEKRVLRAKLAEVCATELGRVDESVAAYRQLVEEDPDDDVAVQTLDRILRATDRKDDLRWLFGVRVERANTAHQLDILGEWAVLEEEAFGAPDQAIATYRKMLELVPEHGAALRALARLLRASGDAAGAAEVIERDRDERDGAERAAREIELARLYIEPLKRYGDALSAAKRALKILPGDRTALGVVEELLAVGETRAPAAVVLEASYAALGELGKQADVLEVMIATAAAKDDRVKLFGRLADVYEKLGALEKAFEVVARVASEFPAELAFWDRLAVLANRTHRSEQLVVAIAQALPPVGETSLPEAVEVDLSERAATLYDEKLGEIDRAQPYLERILVREPGNERAFSRLKQILTTREKWGELESLYERAVVGTTDKSRRASLLAEVALVAEEITGDAPKATTYYERILELEPLHDQAVRALDSLYVSQQRWDRLAALLERRLEAATPHDAIALKMRLGTTYYARLSDPARALGYLEEVLQTDVSNRDARDLVERCLEVHALRPRAAAVLEAVYTAKDEVRELVRVLDIRLESAEAEERRELLARLAELRDERLKDDAGAFEAYARLVPIDPNDANARTRLLDIARRLNAHERAAKVLTEGAHAAASPQPRAEILSEVAKIYENLIGDPARAEAVYKEVLEIDPADATLALPAARSLERIYAASGQTAELAHILKIQVKLESDEGARRNIFGRLGALSETQLGDPKSAIDAWKARLSEDPSDEQALMALDRLYERTGAFAELVLVLRAREKLATDEITRKTLLLRIATTLADKLSDVKQAIVAYRTIVDDFGPERPTLAALAALYEVGDMWQELADTLETDLSLADTPEDRLAVLARLGQVRQARLGNVEGALEAYRQALMIHPAHGPSRGALEALLTDTNARREAAAVLRPLYEGEGEHTRLLRVLDIEAEYAESTADKLALYAQAASVAEGPLGEPSRAFAYASRGLREAVADPELPLWIERAERLSAASGSHADLIELLRAIIPDIADSDLQLDVTLKVAVLARTRLADRELAKIYYAKALELRADDRRVLEALEALYQETSDSPALLNILKRRAEVAESDAERQEILFKEARLCDETLHDATAAISVYEQIVEITPEVSALAALERLYGATERWDDLAALYERQIGMDKVPIARKATLHQRLGAVLEKRLNDVGRAFEQYEAALAIDPQQPETIASLEALMGSEAKGEHAARAAEMLETVYLARLDWRRVMAALDARLSASQDPDARRQLLRRLAKLHEEQEEDYPAALETYAKLLAEDVTDESTWGELERLARVANAEGRLAEVYAGELEKVETDETGTARLAKRTGALFEKQKDTDRALHFYRRAYTFAPEDKDGSFEAIDRLLREAGRPADRIALYREALEHQTEPNERLLTLHTVALLEEAELHDDDKAIETYRAALDIDDSDLHALEALSRLYARRERWRDLAELARRRAEQSALPEDEARFRLELGKLLQHRLEDVSGAVDEYQAVVDLLPVEAASGPAREAIQALEGLVQIAEHKARVVEILRPLYERADDWQKLIRINEERLSLASDPGERISILRESAKLWEERGQDQKKAFDAVRDAFVTDPDDGDTRGELDRLAEATKRWDDLADAYAKGISKTEGFSRKELLSTLAKVHDKKRDDPRRALEAYDALWKLDETDIAPLEEMDPLALLLADWPMLAKVLAKKAELAVDDETRAETWRRIAEARRDMLDDAPGAIEAFERALEIEPQATKTLDGLIALYEEKQDSAKLVDLYRRRVELCGPEEEDKKYELLMLAANRYEVGLTDPREAMQLLNEALSVRPGDVEVVRRLDALYTRERMWPELLENLRLQAAGAPDDASTRTVKKRIGALLAGELEDPRQALEAYREVLDGAFDGEAIEAVRKLGETRDELRVEAADALEPVLRAAERHADLAEVYEMRLRAQNDAPERAKTLRRIAEVAEVKLSDPKRAESALLRALAEEPADPSLHQDIERIAGQLGDEGWQRYADALVERAAAIFDATVTTDLYLRLGRIAEERLKDDARAAKAYSQAGEHAGDTVAVLTALDRLHSRMGDARALADVLERRNSVETSAQGRADLYHRLASLQIREFNEKAQGLATLRLALEQSPEHTASREAIEGLLGDSLLFDDAFEALDAVYRQLNRTEDIAKLYERRVDRAKDLRERSRARLELARVMETEVKDPVRAQRVVEAALADDPSDEDALGELERLAPINQGWRDAADAFERALGAPGGAGEVPAGTLSTLWVRLATWRRDKLDDARGAEGAFVAALKADPENLEVMRSIEALRRAPGRERELVETLRARVKLENDATTKKELLREAKTLAETTIGDRDLAEATLRDLLEEDEGDLWALEELTRLRDSAGDQADVVKLLLQRAELTNDAKEILVLKHRAADTMMGKLGEPDGAIALYREILEHEPSDAVAATKLRELYEKAGREKDLAKLLLHLIETADSTAGRTALRLDLARLQHEKFDSPKDAADTLRAILDEEPGSADAVLALSQLLEKTGQDEELAELLNAQIAYARQHDDAAGELALQVRVGEVFEGRLKDSARALDTYEAVLTKDPSHRVALEAVARLSEQRFAWDRVATALKKLVELATDASGVPDALRLAFALAHLEDSDGIENALQRALELDPKNKEVRVQLRGLYEKAKKWSELAALLVGDADLIADAHPEAVAPAPTSAPVPTPKVSLPPGGSLPPGLSSPPSPPLTGPLGDQVKLLRRAADIHIRERKAPSDAVPILERASALAPSDRELLLQLCDAYTAAARERDAAKVLERVIASFGNRRTKELSLYHHRLGRALASLGDKDVALVQYDMAFKIDPGSVSVLKDLGVLALETNDLDRAQKTFRALLLQRLEPNTGITKGEVFYYLGEISAKQGDKAKAVEMLKRAIENEPTLDRARTKLTELKG